MDLSHLREQIYKDPVLSELSRLAKQMKIPLFLVGGYLRDLVLGKPGKDYDFALPKDACLFIPLIEETLGFHFFKVGKENLDTTTYRILKGDISIDLTFLQGKTIEEDLKRRDFTINAIAFSLREGSFHSMEESLEDIRDKLIRTVSNHSIDQDPLRMLRAIRYLCTLDGFFMDKELKEEISLKKEKVLSLPGERIKAELDQTLLSPQPGMGMKALYESNLLLTIFPEFKGLENLGQNKHHHLDVLSHILVVVEKISWASRWVARNHQNVLLDQEDRLALYYAALFHDIGKKDTYSVDEKARIHFYYHESYSCQGADGIMRRLRFSNQLKERTLHLVRHHMRILNLPEGTKEGALKRLVNQMGEDTPLLVLHTLADKEASRGILSIQIDEVVENHCLRILELFKEKDLVHPPRLVNGHDVIVLGYSPGPQVGQILDFIHQKQIEGEIKNREEALRVLKETFGIEALKR